MTDFNLQRATKPLDPNQGGEIQVRAWLRVIILTGLAGYFAYNIITGNLANYINERFVWLSYVAVGLFFLLAVAAAYQAFAKPQQQNPYRISTSRSLGWGVLLVGALPLVFGVMIPSAPLGAEAVNGNISTTTVRGSTRTDFSIPPEDRNVLDWLRTFNNSDDFTEFNGQPVNVIGFIYREPGFDENTFMVARFTLSCCVADASALALPVHYEQTAELNEGDWVRVEGSLQVGEFGEDVLPIVQVASLTPIEQPEHPYLYP